MVNAARLAGTTQVFGLDASGGTCRDAGSCARSKREPKAGCSSFPFVLAEGWCPIEAKLAGAADEAGTAERHRSRSLWCAGKLKTTARSWGGGITVRNKVEVRPCCPLRPARSTCAWSVSASSLSRASTSIVVSLWEPIGRPLEFSASTRFEWATTHSYIVSAA